MPKTLQRVPTETGSGGQHFELGALLPSQAIFVFAPTWLVAYAGGWGTGKTVALCTRILYQLAQQPFSRAAILRLHASDLRDTTLPVWDEVVPTSWVARRVRTKGSESDTLRNGSTVVFKHIHDPVKGRTHLGSLNVAHIGIDQAEEITEDDFLKVISRARYRKDLYHSIALAFNPAGHNWLWRRFYQGAVIKQGHPLKVLSDYKWVFTKGHSLALAVPTLENTPQCGGYLPPGYYESLRAEYPPEWVARYLDCSFEDFQGKVYPRYDLGSAHNLAHWAPDPEQQYEFGIGIDVGGASPWAIVRLARDRRGRVVVYDEFYKANVSVREVAEWVKSDRNWHRATIVIDPENKVAATELQQFGVVTQVARKDKTANILRVNTYMYPHPSVPHPETNAFGAPRFYVTANCPNTRREHDIRLYDDKGKPSDEMDHTCDAVEYALERMLAPEQPKASTKLEKLEMVDPASAQFWRAIKKKDERDKAHDLEPLRDLHSMEEDPFSHGGGKGTVRDAFGGWD